jgi:nudix-type nucleoside diphosphatase (YffH/AdpP family)
MPPTIAQTKTLYEGWLKIIGVHVRLEDGEEVRREVEDHGRAVAVLPYDPQRRTALLVKLLRAPPLLLEGEPELLEAPAGMVDDDEDPAESAKREAREETGLRLSTLQHVGSVWTSPGISTERMDLYLAPYAESDRVETGGGVADEHENISVVETPLQELWAMAQAGKLADMKTLTLILLLHARHPELFRSR